METELYDLHVHTFLSDGVLGPGEVARRAEVAGAGGIAFADHVDAVTLEPTLEKFVRAGEQFRKHRSMDVLVGCELTHVPPEDVADLAGRARKLGAEFVVVHGETPVEPVVEGTNRAAAVCQDVDLLAHPGRIEAGVAELAAENNVALEISSRRGHSRANGYLVDLVSGLDFKPRLVLCTDAHSPGDFIGAAEAARVLRSAGHTRPSTVLENNQTLFQEAGKLEK